MTRWSTWGLLGLTMVACAPVPPTSPSPTPGPASAPPGVAASPQGEAPASGPAPSVSPSPEASPTALPSPAGHLAPGVQFRAYDWLGLGRPFYDRGTNRLYVADAVERKATDRRFQLLRFDASNSAFLGIQGLSPTEPAGLEAPARAEAVVFDRRGIPLVAHVDKDDRFRLVEALSATVRPVADFQVTEVERIGPVALASDGLIITQMLLRKDPDKNVATGQRLLYTQAERDQQPLALVNMELPLPQVLHVGVGPKGQAYVVGLRADQKPVIGSIQSSNPQYLELAVLPRVPEGFGVDPEGRPILLHHRSDGPARLERLTPQGTTLDASELRLVGGAYLSSVVGFTVDGQGQYFVTGQGLDGTQRIEGLYRFPPAP